MHMHQKGSRCSINLFNDFEKVIRPMTSNVAKFLRHMQRLHNVYADAQLIRD